MNTQEWSSEDLRVLSLFHSLLSTLCFVQLTSLGPKLLVQFPQPREELGFPSLYCGLETVKKVHCGNFRDSLFISCFSKSVSFLSQCLMACPLVHILCLYFCCFRQKGKYTHLFHLHWTQKYLHPRTFGSSQVLVWHKQC